MQKIPIVAALLWMFFLSACQHDSLVTTDSTDTLAPFYQFTMNAIDGTPVAFSQYQNKKVLLVNTATECGFTPQFADLQNLHQQLGNKVAVLGFPANNFGGQEPKENNEITTFCTQNYGVSFQMFEKINVIGTDQHPLYSFLSDATQNGWNNQAPTWNFCKYLIDENGKLTHFFPSEVSPLDDSVIAAINE